MSLYNLVSGMNPSTFFILPLLGKHPEWYPRFRDCFFDVEGMEIAVLTRCGSQYHSEYKEKVDAIKAMPTFLDFADDSEDSTYGMFLFGVPEEWVEDINKIFSDGTFSAVSDKYKETIMSTFPDFSAEAKERLKGVLWPKGGEE